MEAYICDYTNFMKNTCHKSNNTVESYTRDITQFAAYLKNNNIEEIIKASQNNVVAYMNVLKSKGRAASTLSRALASIRSFFVFLIDNGVINENPTNSLLTPHVEKKPPKILSNEEVTLLLEQPNTSEKKGIRDKAMLETLYASGIRVSELIGLDIEDVNLDLGYIKCSNNKGERIVPIGHKAIAALKKYLGTTRVIMVKNLDEKALFVNCTGGRISRQGFWKIIKTYQESSGIQMDITPHSLRHSFAAHLIENGADLQSLKTMMGHADISSTQVYTCFLDEKVRAVYEKAHPRAL